MDLRAVIFMPALAGAVIFGFVFVLFAAHYYLTVLESTATGAKEVTWISEQIVDNFWKLWYMLWLFGLWFGPAYLIGRVMTSGSDSVWLKLAIPIAFVGLCYPISQLSSLSASTIWLPLTPDVFARLAQKPVVTFGFYLLSIPVLALFAVAFKWAFLTKGEWTLLFIGAPLMVFSGFLYARLIGRLAFVLKYTKPLRREKSLPKPKADDEAKPRGKSARMKKRPSAQPRDLPPLTTFDGELTGYDVKFEDDPPAKNRVMAEVADEDDEEPDEPVSDPVQTSLGQPVRRRALVDDDDDSPYGVHEAEVDTKSVAPSEHIKPTEEEMRLLKRDDLPKEPTAAWQPELLAFLGQQATVSAIVIASGFCVVVGLMVRIAREFNPLD